MIKIADAFKHPLTWLLIASALGGCYYLFRLFHVGGAVFFDAGRTWGNGNAGGTSEGWLTDAGFGLRFASSRSSFGKVIHVDLAFPFNGDSSIDNVQFLVETKRSF